MGSDAANAALLAESHVNRDRPSIYGAAIGAVLADLERIGREAMPDLAASCLTCAFSRGSAPNQSPSTALTALKCTMGTDPDPFGCHHGMAEGLPTKLCAGYYAAKHAFEHSYPSASAMILDLAAVMKNADLDDTVRAEFDQWLAAADPLGVMDNYQIARAYAVRSRSNPHKEPA